MADRAQIVFRPAHVDSGDGATLAQALRDDSARGLYESEGYLEVPDFNGNPVAVFWAEKPLR
jgi:hypothetical protein